MDYDYVRQLLREELRAHLKIEAGMSASGPALFLSLDGEELARVPLPRPECRGCRTVGPSRRPPC